MIYSEYLSVNSIEIPCLQVLLSIYRSISRLHVGEFIRAQIKSFKKIRGDKAVLELQVRLLFGLFKKFPLVLIAILFGLHRHV